MRIASLCNHPLAIPAVDYLLKSKMLVGLGCPAIPNDNLFRMQALVQQNPDVAFAMIDGSNMEKDFKEWFRQCSPEVVFVFTFPFKIPASVLDSVEHGFFNFHPGRLPHYRGGDPIFWQVRYSEQHGGITVHEMDEEFDRGPVLHYEQLEIPGDDTYGQQAQKLAITNRKACQYIVENFSSLQAQSQDDSQSYNLKRPSFLDLIIDWQKYSAQDIKALVLAANPTYGGAIAFFRKVPIHLMQISVGSSKNPPDRKPGTILKADKDGLIILSKDHKLIRLDVTYSEDGFFTGGKLATTFGIKQGEEFTGPPINAQQPSA